MAGDFEARYLSLLKAIDECVAMLRAADESQFADWLELDRSKIADGKTRALQHLLSAYGGAGSINDILLEDPRAQMRLTRLRNEIWKQADAMLRELDEGGHYLRGR
ncbi:MAG: hypothetical protein E6I89_15960 [Chloroflexi bacterium]|nr:MAG: hypothetical protein E6I89_15960 [Chloroflexota bacterium]